MMSSSAEVACLLTMLFLQGVYVNGDCSNMIDDDSFGTNLWYQIKKDNKAASDTNFECRELAGQVVNTTNTALLSYIVNASGSSETSFWVDQYSTDLGSFPPSCRYYDVISGLIVMGSWECLSKRTNTICTYPRDDCIPIPEGTEHCPYGFVEVANRTLCFAAILSQRSTDPCNEFGVNSIPIVYDSGNSDHINLLKNVVDAFDYPDLLYNIKKEGSICDVYHRNTELITQASCSELENRVLCQHNMTYDGPCPAGAVYGGDYPPGHCYFMSNNKSKSDLFEACQTGYVLVSSDLSLLKWIAESSNLEGESFFIAPLVFFTALYNDSAGDIRYELSGYNHLHPFICDQRAMAAPIPSSENETSGFSTTLPVQTTLVTQNISSEMLPTTQRDIDTSTTTMYYDQSTTNWQPTHGSTTHSNKSSTGESDATTTNATTSERWTSQTYVNSKALSTEGTSTMLLNSINHTYSSTNHQSSSVTWTTVTTTTNSYTSTESHGFSEQLTTNDQLTSDSQSDSFTTENASVGYNQTDYETTTGK